VEYARKVALSYAEKARKTLNSIELDHARDKLLEMADYLTDRDY
jgi:geranylgeranyl pyrophosphate synthase